MEHRKAVKAAIDFFRQQSPTAAEDLEGTCAAFVAMFEGQGVERERAEALFLFVPLAFSRHVLESTDISVAYPRYYVEAYSDSPKETEKRLRTNALFRAAAKTARRCKSQDDARKIASFSPEYQVIQNIISTAEAEDVEIMATGVSPPYLYHEVPSDRPWWKFW